MTTFFFIMCLICIIGGTLSFAVAVIDSDQKLLIAGALFWIAAAIFGGVLI